MLYVVGSDMSGVSQALGANHATSIRYVVSHGSVLLHNN
jgi:hypothetical protein